MRLKWDESAWEEYTEIQARDKQMLKRINMLVKDAMRSPFEGIGKPEGLKWNLQGSGAVALTMRTALYIL